MTEPTYCRGCGHDLWEYTEDIEWCVACAPEQFGAGSDV